MVERNFHELILLDELFDNGKRTFFIPDYQRGYSWENRQCQDLIDDLERIIKNKECKKYTHFMGTVVAFPQDSISESYEIVDGQQRLTTLSILMSCLYHKLKYKPDLQFEIGETFLLRNRFSKPQQVLTLGAIGEQNDIFYQLINEGKISEKIKNRQWIKSDIILGDAYNFFENYLTTTDFKIEDILKTLREDIGFILYKPSTSLETSVMFEVINNRGKVLSELEKVKNWLHYRLQHEGSDQELKRFHRSWAKILENLSKAEIVQNDDENSFLRYSWIVFGDTDKNKSHHVYDSLKAKKYNISTLLSFVDFLETSSSIYVQMDSASSHEDKSQRYLQRIKYHSSHTSIIPLILSICSNEAIATEEKEEILKLIERLNFRFYCCGIRRQSNSEQAYFYSMANDCYNKFDEAFDNDENQGEAYNAKWIKKELKLFISKNANDEKFEKALRDEERDFASWHDLKFFLASYEYWLHGRNKDRKNLDTYMHTPQDKKDGKVTNNNLYQKEHIWARKCIEHLNSGKAEDIKERYLGKLGNFILLNAGSNASNSKDAIEKKVDQYMVGKDGQNFDNSLAVKAIVTNFNTIMRENPKPDNDWWDPYYIDIYQKFLDKNENDLVEFALERWS